ncbi:class I SAM-dependent methyltransferase [Desulfovibrio psychrotolerans]|uniref:Methyltransferase n=1 Tax=Desulfovibrio psychrotolerans TaxID=415242 RepID=A0A7J0BZB7_9BACT|nr:class I SAM-dependent methyltransferase [Desulfovibrio psychrotolerans]GFM38545.1 hypothetical protein DSM19430T_32290 [Desulfovibrio psychrotolerans]
MNLKAETPVACPVCGAFQYRKLYPEYAGRCITSQMFFLDDVVLDNRVCTACGCIFNARGVRGIEEQVYSNATWKPKPQLLNFSSGTVVSSHQKALDTFLDLYQPPEFGRLLDFGAGTGAFLACFQARYPRWEITAIEPGDGFSSLRQQVTLHAAYNTPYYLVDTDATFDMIVVTSVLEHVANPLHALEWIRSHLTEDGVLLMQHPNFEKLPGDLFCADHINKLTPSLLKALSAAAGFGTFAENNDGVMFYQAQSLQERSQMPSAECVAQALRVAEACEQTAISTIECVRQAVFSARKKGGRAAVFGTSPIGSMAHLLLDCKPDIACFVDENPNVWGRDIDTIPVIGPEDMKKMNVTDLALAISPVYWQAVQEKMKAYAVAVHVPNQPGQPD